MNRDYNKQALELLGGKIVDPNCYCDGTGKDLNGMCNCEFTHNDTIDKAVPIVAELLEENEKLKQSQGKVLSVDEIVNIARTIFLQHQQQDMADVGKEVRKYGLVDIHCWDNKDAGFFDVNEYFKDVATAIHKAQKGE